MQDLVKELSDLLRDRRLMLATAESCTGGMIAAAMTDFAGASAVFDRGFVTYSNQAKIEMLGVDADIITTHGAVSEPCAAAMVEGAVRNSNAGVAVSVTGVAGPDGGSKEKPVGTVFIGFAAQDTIEVESCLLSGERESVRVQTVEAALRGLVARLQSP